MTAELDFLQQTLHQDIPLTRAMELTVTEWDGRRLCLELPLKPNINHQLSMFGGSLYSGAVLAGWGWLTLRLRAAELDDCHVVIQHAEVSYPRPVDGTARALCEGPSDEQWSRFEQTLCRRGRARLALRTWVLNPANEEAVRFDGHFVVQRDGA